MQKLEGWVDKIQIDFKKLSTQASQNVDKVFFSFICYKKISWENWGKLKKSLKLFKFSCDLYTPGQGKDWW